MKLKHFLSILTVLIIFTGCKDPLISFNDPKSYFIVGNSEEKKFLRNLLTELETIEGSDNRNFEKSYTIIQQIQITLNNLKEREKLNLFLTTYVEKNIDDPFNAYYLYVVAQNYINKGASPFAVHYFERILKNYQDIQIKGRSIHFICLQNLIEFVKEPVVRVNYYKELLARFSENIDKGPAYYYLAQTYEALGEWDLSIQAYTNFLNYNCIIPEVPDARDIVSANLQYYNFSNKNWTEENLDTLISKIRYAIQTRNASLLKKYRADVGFFTGSWEKGEGEPDTDFFNRISVFLKDKPYVSQELDPGSNTQEAYLRTSGWSYRIMVWYLYFRKVIFPADPEIHGRWEWQGIYFGEKPYSEE